MELFLLGLTVLTGCAVGWSIGANDAANSLGVAVGSKVLTLRQALFLICVFGFLGAYFQGSHVVRTVGKGIVPISDLEGNMPVYVAMVSSIAAFVWVLIATALKMPISTSHSIVGAVAGAGLAIGAPVCWRKLVDVFICWVVTPLGAAVIAYVLYFILKHTFHRVVPDRIAGRVLALLIVLSGCYVAFTWGANDVANAVGVIAGSGRLSVRMSLVLGSAAILLGVVTWGYKVIETIGSNIVQMLPLMAFSAQLASSINVHVYTMMGVPVSTSHSIVGAVVGVGLVRGVRVVNMSIMREIVVCWVATPFVSGVLSFLMLKILTLMPGVR
ncbi:inorganic phosphate transporter [bacterium]|nr:inorganic phosphate transporter [bacterium]